MWVFVRTFSEKVSPSPIKTTTPSQTHSYTHTHTHTLLTACACLMKSKMSSLRAWWIFAGPLSSHRHTACTSLEGRRRRRYISVQSIQAPYYMWVISALQYKSFQSADGEVLPLKRLAEVLVLNPNSWSLRGDWKQTDWAAHTLV